MCRLGRNSLAAVALLAMSTAVIADGVVLNGVSPRSLGRGGTNLGHFDNGGILHDNPAAMTNVARNGLLDLGFDLLVTDFGYSEPGGHDGDSTVCPLPQVAYIQKSCDGAWAYGIGVFTPAGFGENMDLPGPVPIGGTQHYKSYAALLKILPGVSCQVAENLSVGGTFGVGISHAELEGPYFLQGPSALAGTPTLLDTQGTGATPVWSLGLQYLLSESTTFGASYTSASAFDLEGNTRVTVPGLGSTTYDSTLEVTWPQSFGAGIRHELNCCSTISADAVWYDWSGAFDAFDMTLTSPSNPLFPSVVESFPLRWKDSVSLRLGYEHKIHNFDTFRCGYVYHDSPVPDGTLTPYVQATLEHTFSLGYMWSCWEWDVDTAYMFMFAPDRSVGTSELLGGDFNNSHHTAYLHVLGLSFLRAF